MKRFLLATPILFSIALTVPQPALSQQDPPHKSCCFLIYSTGVELGGLKSTAYFGKPSLAPEVDMARLLFRISNWVEAANALCSDRSRAWDNYRAIQSELDELANGLATSSSFPGNQPRSATAGPRVMSAYTMRCPPRRENLNTGSGRSAVNMVSRQSKKRPWWDLHAKLGISCWGITLVSPTTPSKLPNKRA